MGNASEQRLTLIHRVIVPDTGYPKEYAILVTDRRSIFIRQPKSRSNFWLEGEMRWGTALVTDVVPKNLEDYAKSSLDSLSSDPTNIAISHGSVISVAMKADKPTFRRREFFVRLTMKRQWGTFFGTDLDLQLRRRKLETLVLCGIATNYGVESTARFAYEYGYQQIFAEDAMTSMSVEMHNASVNYALRMMGRVRSTGQILRAL